VRREKFGKQFVKKPREQLKLQISSTKLQINLKSQYSMTKTCTAVASYDAAKLDPVMMKLKEKILVSFFCNLEF